MSKQEIYHIVFPTYKRLPLLHSEEYKLFITNDINMISKEKNISLITFKVLTDHIHLLVRILDSQLLPEVIKNIKGITTYNFYKQFPDIKIQIGRGRLWAKGYNYKIVTNQEQLNNTMYYIKHNSDKYIDQLILDKN